VVLTSLENEESTKLGLPKVSRHKKEIEDTSAQHSIKGSIKLAKFKDRGMPLDESLAEKAAAEKALEGPPPRTPAERPDRGKIKFFDRHADCYALLQETMPRVEFGSELCPPPAPSGFLDKAALYNNGLSILSPVTYLGCLLVKPCVAKAREDDLRFSPWDEFPLTSRDVTKWMNGDEMVRPLISKFRSQVGPVSGRALRSYTRDSPIMSLFDGSAMERVYRDQLLASIDLMLHHEAELLSPFLLNISAFVRRSALKPLPKTALPLQSRGSEKQKLKLVRAINAHFNSFLAAMDKALARQYHGPLDDWIVRRGGSLGYFDMKVVAYLVWLTGGCTTSMRLVMPRLKQYTYDESVVSKNAL